MKPHGFSSSRPSNTKQTTQHHSNSAMRQSSVSSTEHQQILSGAKQVGQMQPTPVLTPVQQKFSSNLLHSDSGAAINNYLSSGGRVVQGENINQSVQAADLFLNQFNRANMKKSEVKQLQKYCEQNGLDFSSVFSQPPQHHQLSKSLSKERKVGLQGPSPSVPPQQYFMQQQKAQAKITGGSGANGSKSQSHRPNQKSYQTPQPNMVPQHQYQNSHAVNQANLYNNGQGMAGQQHHHGQVLHNSSSMSAMMIERSPLAHNNKTSHPKMSQKQGGLSLANFAVMPTGAGGIQSQTQLLQQQQIQAAIGNTNSIQSTKQVTPSQKLNKGLQPQPQQQQRKQQLTAQNHPMMPSQMSINEVLLNRINQNQQQDHALDQAHLALQQQQYAHNNQPNQNHNQNPGQPGQNFSASNGYFSQKTSPIGRLNVGGGISPDNQIKQGHGVPGLKSNKVIRQPHVTGPGTSKAKSNLHNASQKDLSIAYQAQTQKRSSLVQGHHQAGVSNAGGHHTNSTGSLDKKYQIDSGVGVISGGQSSLNPRKDTFQRGIQVEMKTALHSRRKHGSIDTYKQGTNHSGSNGALNHQIRQGQGEIAPQRVAVATHPKNNSIFKQGTGQGNQLPKVIRNQNNKTGVVSGASKPSDRIVQPTNHQQMSSTPSINNNSAQKPGRHTASSPSEEMRYQSSNYTNAIRQSALSRGSIKQSSQHALSGSNQMNLSLSQNSSRGLQKSHKDTSVEQLQERRIAYEASQGKMTTGQQAAAASLRSSVTTAKSSGNEMLLAYSQHQQQNKANSPVFGPQDDLNQQVPNIVLHQKQLTGNSQRHSRIRTKSNHSSLDRISNQELVNNNSIKHAPQNKRGAITAAQNSPRQTLSQLKAKQPRIPEPNQEIEKYYNQRVSQQNSGAIVNSGNISSSTAAKRTNSTGKATSEAPSYHLAQAMKAQSSSLMSKTPSQDFQTVPQQQPQHLQMVNYGQQRQQQVSLRQPNSQLAVHEADIEHQQQLAFLHQQQSSSTASQPRFEDSATTIEQYSRKLHTPNPILDGGTGSGGAQVSSNLQHQTRKLLQDQQVLLEKLGYVPGHESVTSGNTAQTSMVYNESGQKIIAVSYPQQNIGGKVQGGKKSTLLQMQQQNQKQHSDSTAKMLNLSHNLGNNHNSLNTSNNHPIKQVHTKTSAQTASTRKDVGHPKFLQYANSKQSTANSGNGGGISNMTSVKIKKQTTQLGGAVQQQSQSNLIMAQHASKRSSSQEIVIQHIANQQPQSTVKVQPVAQTADIGIQGISSSEHQHNHTSLSTSQHHHQLQNTHTSNFRHNPNKNNPSINQRVVKGHGGKGEKRSSSQPTVVATTNADIASVSQVKYLPKHYNNDSKQRMYYQQRRLSDGGDQNANVSRQAIGVRTSQKSQQQVHSRSSITGPMTKDKVSSSNLAAKQQQLQKSQHQQQQQQQLQQQNQNSSNKQSRLNIDYQSVKVQIGQEAISAAPHQKNIQAVSKAKKLQQHGGQQQQDEQAQVIAKRLRKQSSVPQLHAQPVGSSAHQHNRSELSKSSVSKQSSANMRKSQSNGPGRPQYSVNQPNVVARPETLLSDIDNRRLITEDDEQEIRQVASDINEQAFYGKIIRTKKALNVQDEFSKLSPRSQEIGYVMQKVERAFTVAKQPPITDITFYRIGKMLGRGAFGKVNLAMHKLVRKLVALKSLNKEALTDEVQKAKLMKEVNLLLKLRQNNVVKIYETIETQKHIIIVMELCAGGDLLNYVRKRRRLKEPFAQKIFRQIIDGLSYIHSKNIAHRDIKLDNILLDGKGNVKIADFGVSRQIQPDQIMREQCGTPAYIAPEILRNRGYSLNVDLWSAGVVLFAMLYGTVPFKAQTMDELHQLILKGKYLLKEDISAEARDLLRGLLEINPKKRISIRKIFKHPWLRSMDPTVQLFNDEERKMIKKEYTYNDGSRYNRNENEEPVDCFTQHNLESQYSTLKNQESKSIILAPFNSTMSEQSPIRLGEVRSKIDELMEVKQQVLRFSKKCREIDRQYEFNNNGQLDNGVYHKVVANNSFEQQDKFEETQGIEIEQSLTSIRNQQRKGKSASNARNNQQISASEQSSFLSMAEDYLIQNNQPRPLDPPKVQKLVSFGYPEPYVVNQMREMHPNYCTAGYYLLEMDQNYC